MSALVWATLSRVRSRMTWQRAVRVAFLMSMGGLTWGIAVQALSSVLPVAVSPGWVYGGSALAALLGLLVGRLTLIPSLYEAAHLLDRTCGLEDRMTTALALAQGRVRSRLGEHVLEEANRALLRADVRRVVSIRRGADPRVLVLAGMVLLWDLLLSGATLPGTPARRVAEAIRAESRRLEQKAVQIGVRARAERLLRTAEEAERVRGTARALRDPRVTRQEAVARLRALVDQVERARQAAEGLLREELGTSRLPARAALEPQSIALRELLSRWQSVATPRERERIREALRDLSAQTRDLPPSVRASLRRAREALHRGDPASALQALGQAREDLEGLRRLASEVEALQALAWEAERSAQNIQAGGKAHATVEERDSVTGSIPRPAASPGPGRVKEKGVPNPEGLAKGPNEGLRAGQGRGPEALGAPTERLGTEHKRERLPGIPQAGMTTATEARGAGVRNTPRADPVRIPPVVVRRSEEAMVKDRIPSPYRDLVRRYFLELGQRRE